MCEDFQVIKNQVWFAVVHRYLQKWADLEVVFQFLWKKYGCWIHLFFSASSAWLIFNSLRRILIRVPIALKFLLITIHLLILISCFSISNIVENKTKRKRKILYEI